MNIHASIEAYQIACEHLQHIVKEQRQTATIAEAELSIGRLEQDIMRSRPVDADELLAKLSFVEQLVFWR